jgi:uncharacterized membrane protein SpoIIM required for sporulation
MRRVAWQAFRTRALAIERSGLGNCSGAEVIAFATAYREIAADLARARTYGADGRLLDWLGRAVTAGHNVLYGARRRTVPPLDGLVFDVLPGSVWAARRYVLLAFLLFAAPAVGGYTLLRARPALAPDVLPVTILERADARVEAGQGGPGYAETPSPYLPLVATSIIANNVQVAFGAFAMGVTAGVGTVFILVFNGLFFGSILGYFSARGIAPWLLTFVAGHGVLELTAIFIAGGAGLVLARAIVAPGDLARADALALRGRLALRMVGAATGLLLLAGAIEGLLSASDATPVYKVGVSLLSAVLLGLLAVSARRAATAQGADAGG